MKRLTTMLLFAVGCSSGATTVHEPTDGDGDSGHGSDVAAPTPDGGDPSTSPDGGHPPGEDADLVDEGPPPPMPVPGVTAEYFAQYRVPVLTRIEPAVNHVWGDGAPADGVPADFFSARWTAELIVPAAGTYRFNATVDDGLRLWVNGELVIDAWTWQFPTSYSGTVDLPAGQVSFMAEYMERDLTAQIQIGWGSDAIPDRMLEESDFLTFGEASGLPAPKSPYLNPVVPFDCPDPGVIRDPDDGVFYAICTGGPFHIRRSYDLVFWEDTGADVLPAGKPAWAANGGRNWAPEIHKVGDKWIVYYTTVNGSNVLSIGAAYADSPTGPYTDKGSPLVISGDGVIDANYFRDDDGKHYLSFKIDGNAHGRPTPIYIRELAPDGLSFAPGSQNHEMIRNNSGTWEGGVVEAQWLIKHDGMYYLFYSGNVYDNRYRTGVARASNVLGPYTKMGGTILANNSRWVGPGHGSVIKVGGEWLFVYHAWPNRGNGQHDTSVGRNILVDRIRWEGGWPRISNGTPSTTAQPPFNLD